MKKIAFLSLLSAVVLFTFPSCESAREERAEEVEERNEEIEDAADDADAAPLEEAADRRE